MRSLRSTFLLVTVATPFHLIAQQFEPPTVLKQVEPQYPPELKAFIVQPAKVEIVIDYDGNPFSLNSATGLPDNVVQALSKWRFHPARKGGNAVSSSVVLTVPIHRPIESAEGLRRSYRMSKEVAAAFVAAKDLDAAKAAALEKAVENEPGPLTDRLKLLAYAKSHAGPEFDAMRLRQILWLAKNDPKDPVLGAPFAAVSPAPAIGADIYEQVRQLWKTALTENPNDPAILDHATNFLRFSDPGFVEARPCSR